MTVHLVGAGPGDPSLLTVAAAELIRRARVLVYDRPSMAAIVALAPADAETHVVGLQRGKRALTQTEVNDLLVELGRKGDVVRLKSGDPFVASRGGEEALALQDAGIAVNVIPGVSAALAAPAAAGIPLMLRQNSVTATFVDGNDDDEHAEPPDWHKLAALGGTLVILTGRGRIRRIAAAADRGRSRARDADRGDQRREPRRAAHPARHPVHPPGPVAAARHVRGRRGGRAGAHVHIPEGFLTGEAAALGTAHRRGGGRRVPARRVADRRGRRTCPSPAWRRRSSSSARRRSSRSRSAPTRTCSAARSRSRCSARTSAR